MSEMGKAMMGSAAAAGVDRARIAADQAVASPLLEGIELSGARGVLVNITASDDLGMKEVREVMNTIRTYAAPDATIIFGTVFDNAMEDTLRVTVVATGLGGAIVKAAKPMLKTVMGEGMGLRTGTDNQIVDMGGDVGGMFTSARSSARNTMVDSMTASGVDKYDIPAFLRRQAD
jgi:cell division protein FtsZ